MENTIVSNFKEFIRKDIKEQAEKQNLKFIDCKIYSNHIDDLHLFIVATENLKGEYVTYLYNAETKSFNHGHYFVKFEGMVADYKERKFLID